MSTHNTSQKGHSQPMKDSDKTRTPNDQKSSTSTGAGAGHHSQPKGASHK